MTNGLKKYILALLLGSSFGLFFPYIFILLDLRQLEESFGIEEIFFIIKSQNIYLFSLFAFPLVFSLIFILIVNIINSRKKIRLANKNLKKERKKTILNSRLASLGILSAGIGHEINNPLLILQANFHTLKKEIKKQALSNLSIDKAYKSIDDMLSRIKIIVSGLKNFTQKTKDDMIIVEMNHEIKSSLSIFEKIYSNENISIIYNLSENQAQFLGNKGPFQQIVLNLVSNARDSILESKTSGTISISTEIRNGLAIMAIKDNGAGIKKDHLPHIFDTFFTTKEAGKGTGMGLSIIHSIIKELKGEISVESTQEEGATFTVSFPLYLATQKRKSNVKKKNKNKDKNKKPSSEVIQNSLKGRVLIVDDEEIIRLYLTELLTHYGLHVEEAVDGIQALNMIQKKKYDLILTDLKMPRMTGEELIKEIRLVKKLKTKIIVISGGSISNFNKDEQISLSDMVSSYIEKPFTSDCLYKRVKKTLKN